MFRDAVKYPTRGKDIGRRYLIGVLLTLGIVLIIPAFILLGYYTKAMSQTLQGKEEIPKFEDYTGLFLDGLKLTGIMVLYLPASLLPLIVASEITGPMYLEATAGLAGLILFLTVLYVLPAAMVSFSRDGKMKDAFLIREIGKKSFTSKYFLGILTLIGTSILIGLAQIAVLIALTISLIGIPAIIGVFPAMRFYENLVYFRMMAKITE